MNRIAAALIIFGAVTGTGYAAVQVGYDVREHVLETRCIEQGRTPLWQSSGSEDHRPDGALPFHCVENSSSSL